MAKRKDPNAPKWEQLSYKLLSAEGRQLVSADPNLSDKTLRMLQVSEQSLMVGCMAANHPWYLDVTKDGSDVSASLIASCINDNIFACMAELVARYAEVRNLTFCETACKLCQLRDEGKLYRWNMEYPYTLIKWTPTPRPPYVKPPKRRASKTISSSGRSAAAQLS